ncbi:ninjurin-1 isoform X1 [Salvelinus sp. IW2-2015]
MINMNHYATKKSVAQSMLDVALLMANSSQLKTVLYMESQYRFYKPLIVLLSMSITLQVVVGLLLVFIVLINIFITALGFEGAV